MARKPADLSLAPHVLGVHGTYASYRKGGCRCGPCTDAFMGRVPHGTISGANWHRCPCRPCKDARNKYDRARRARLREERRAALTDRQRRRA